MKKLYIEFPIFSFYIKFIVYDNAVYNLILALFSNIVSQSKIFGEYAICKKATILKKCNNNYIIKYEGYNYEVNEEALVETLIDFASDSFNCFPRGKFAFFHASVVNNEEKTTLIIAPTHQGKTTLCTELSLLGYNYLADDCAIVDEYGNLWAYPLPIKLRKNPAIDITKYESKYSIIEIANYWILTLRNKSDLKKFYKPKNIFFLNRTLERNKFNFEKLSCLETIDKLIVNASYRNDSLLHSKISILLSKMCESYYIIYNDYNEIIKTIDFAL